MAAQLTVIWWRGIPAQVLARGGGRSHKIVLHQRFQAAIDRAADRAGKNQSDAYLAEWRRVSRRCGDDLEAEAAAEAASLEARFGPAVLNRLAEAGGQDGDAAMGGAIP